MKEFSKRSSVSRQALAGVGNKVTLRQQIVDLDTQLDSKYYEWLDCCDKTSEDLEGSDDPLRPSLIASKFEESGEILDKVDDLFKQIKGQYPEKQVVVDYLDFIDKAVNEKTTEIPLHTHKSTSEGSSRGEEYIKAKVGVIVELRCIPRNLLVHCKPCTLMNRDFLVPKFPIFYQMLKIKWFNFAVSQKSNGSI